MQRLVLFFVETCLFSFLERLAEVSYQWDLNHTGVNYTQGNEDGKGCKQETTTTFELHFFKGALSEITVATS